MKLIALMCARNEGWCIGFSVRAALAWCDEVIVLCHACTDNTVSALEGIYGVTILHESNPDWNEGDYRQRLLEAGRERGGDVFAIVDCDEALTANLLPRIRFMAESLNPAECLRLPWLCLWRSLDEYRCDDSPFGKATAPVLFRDAPGLTHKPADNYQWHGRVPKVTNQHVLKCEGGLLHLQHVVWDRVLWKQRLYEMVETLRWGSVRVNYWQAVDETGLQTRAVPREWWPKGREHIDLEAEAWQVEEAKKLIEEHGTEKFKDCRLMKTQ